jgi:hypothetical protein
MAVINNFPIKIITPPTPSTAANLPAFLKTIKKPSAAAEQKFFPYKAI